MVSRIGSDLTLHFLRHRYRHRHRRFRLGCRLVLSFPFLPCKIHQNKTTNKIFAFLSNQRRFRLNRYIIFDFFFFFVGSLFWWLRYCCIFRGIYITGSILIGAIKTPRITSKNLIRWVLLLSFFLFFLAGFMDHWCGITLTGLLMRGNWQLPCVKKIELCHHVLDCPGIGYMVVG